MVPQVRVRFLDANLGTTTERYPRMRSGCATGRNDEYTARPATITLATITGAACKRIPYVIQHNAAAACTHRIVTGLRTK